MLKYSLIFLLSMFLVGCTVSKVNDAQSNEINNTKGYQGSIYLFGELHNIKKILDKENELWNYFYKKGMRHLFIEFPYYTAEYLNMWMKQDDDEILLEIYNALKGTPSYSSYTLDFYRKIKEECPDTVFHGTDVGHQFNSLGKKYLQYLEDQDVMNYEQIFIVKEVIAQGVEYYSSNDNPYREKMMVKNFLRELKSINNEDIMGIYGSYHTRLDNLLYTGTIPNMAKQLKTIYGEKVYSEDLSYIVK